jgi:hypothetical protein
VEEGVVNRPEKKLEGEVLMAFARDPGVWVQRNVVGDAYYGALGPALERALADFPAAREIARQTCFRHHFECGLGTGSPDLILSVDGLFLGLELKSPTGTHRPSQLKWQAMADGRGVPHDTARSVQDALDAVATRRARR